MSQAEADRRSSRIHLLDVFPELGRRLGPEQARIARQHALARVDLLEPGRWAPEVDAVEERGCLGVLVVEGLMTREVILADTVATELVGRGDLLRPSEHDGRSAPVPFDVSWRVIEPTRIATLDRQFTEVIGHFPDALEFLVSAGVRRAQSLALHLAVSHLRRVDTRLLVIMWHLADRWGTVGREGVAVPLKLTHQALGRLVGAQRPSVTTALKQLAEQGTLTRTADGGWLLHGEPPHVLQRIRSGDAPVSAAAEEITG